MLSKITISPERRAVIKSIVLGALQHASAASLPVPIKAVCRSYANIRLIPFSVHMNKQCLTLSEVKELCGTSDSCADYHAKHNRYIIYYNDVDMISIVNSNRYRWNIAHELGHVLLGHHQMTTKTRICRSSLSNELYDYFELEADYFAQLILVPHVVLYAFKIQTPRQLKQLCKISGPAANRRFRAYEEWRNNIVKNDTYDKPLFYHYYDFIFKKSCTTCGASIVQRYGKYCPVCGSKTLQWGDGKMIYKKLEVHENGKLKTCPICKNEETNINGNYCQICARYLVNECTDCNEPLPANARYCPICGNKSTYFTNQYLKAWDYQEPSPFIELPFDIEDDSLPFN